MAIEVRFVDDKGYLVIVCTHCGEEIESNDQGVASWVPEDRDIPGVVLTVEYAHEDCEDRYLSQVLAGPGHASAAKKINAPLREFFELLRGS
jgi:hypothetical protein